MLNPNHYLGRHAQGHTYWYNPADNYVYQFAPNGERVGYLCHAASWERALHRVCEGEHKQEVTANA
jgi:hypothetical protein